MNQTKRVMLVYSVLMAACFAPATHLIAVSEVTGGIHGANRLGGNGVADIVENGKIAGRGLQ